MKDINRVVGQNRYEYQYDVMFEKFQNGEISEKEWTDFCGVLLQKLMIAYSDVLQKLKNI